MVFDSELDAQMAIQLAQITSIAQVKDLKLQATLRVLFAPLGPKARILSGRGSRGVLGRGVGVLEGSVGGGGGVDVAVDGQEW